MRLMGSEAKVDAPEPGRRERQRLAREARVKEAMDAANSRAARGRATTIAQRLEQANKALDSNVAGARQVLDGLSPNDLDLYLLAETTGRARKGVLQGYPLPSKRLLEQYAEEPRPTPQAADSEE